LEKALKMRAWTENEAKIELGRAVGELSALELSIEANARARDDATSQRFADGKSMMLYENYIQRLDAEKDELFKRAAEAELKLEAARTAWTDAKTELKTMENLKDRRFAEYRSELLAEEEKNL
jgi:flagellar export protein FliJ